MDAEIQFFMTAIDEQEFLAFAETQIDSCDKESTPMRLVIGDCELLFTSSITEADIMYAGKLEIHLESTETTHQDLEQAKFTFRKLRNRIKKKYWSRLAYKNKNDRLTPSRVHWLAPDAKKWKEENPERHILKLSRTSWIAFDIGF